MPHKYKVIVAGNHDIGLDFERYGALNKQWATKYTKEDYNANVKIMSKYTYLQCSAVTILGYKIYGFPHVTKLKEWAFNVEHKKMEEICGLIPDDTDILLCHTPPYKFADLCVDGF